MGSRLTLVDRSHIIDLRRRPCEEDGAEVYEVKQIIGKRGRGSRLEYLVEWVGYPSWEATWESPSSLGDARDAIAEFESRS